MRTLCLASLLLLPLVAVGEENLEQAWVEALGGQERLGEVERVEVRGSTQMMVDSDPFPLIIRAEKPNRLWMSVSLPAGEVIRLYDGEQAWFRTILPDDPGEWFPMEPGEAAEFRNLAYETAHLNAATEMSGREVSAAADGAVLIEYPSGVSRKRWYDEAGLLIRETSADGDSEFSAFEEFDGIPFATEITTHSGGGSTATRIDEVLINPEFEPDQFSVED